MGLIGRVVAWMDRHLARRDYGRTRSMTPRLTTLAPLLLALPVIEIAERFGASRHGPVVAAIVICGLIGCFLVGGTWLYIGMRGYSQSDRQDRAAKEHRAQAAERRRWWRSLFRR